MRRVLIAVLALAVIGGAGCSSKPVREGVPNLPQAMPVDPPGGSLMLTANTYAGDALQKMLLLRMGAGGGILTTSFVDMHDFEKTSAFGRVISQQIGSRLGQYGFKVIEARLASTLSMTPRVGEFMLTRETARLLSDTYDAGAVLVGSYSAESDAIFVSTRVVRLSDNAIMAAYEYYLPRDGDAGRLLTGKRSGANGDAVWRQFSGRTPAFAPCGSKPATVVSAPSPRVAEPSPRGAAPSGGVAPGTRKGASMAAPGPGSSQAVPRYVDPEARATEPVRKKAAAPVAKAPAPVAPTPAPAPTPKPVTPVPPVPQEKDAPTPPSVPGGA